MPLPRFHKLPREKQLELLEAGSSELAIHGIEGVSLGSIVERVGLSKSAVYYYFIDKEDLLDTVLLHNYEEAIEIVGDFDREEMRANYWPVMLRKKLEIVRYFAERPESRALWQLALTTTEASRAPESLPASNSRIREKWAEMLAVGRECGAVRTDLSMPLLLDLVLLVESVGQRHALDNFSGDPEEMAEIMAARGIDLIRRLVSPETERT